MDSVTAAQFLVLKDSFARKGVEIEAALTPGGELDYIYVVDRLLAADRDDNMERLRGAMPGLIPARAAEQPELGDLVRLSTDRVSIDGSDPGALTVPELLDRMEERFPSPGPEGEPLVSPVHIVYISKITPFGEPDLPSGATTPFPAPLAHGGKGKKIGISDTGLQPNLNVHPWMTNVTGDAEPLGKILPPPPQGLRRIPRYAGHGTFAAGVAKCAAPEAAVFVNNHFTESEGEEEDVMIAKLDQLIKNQNPDVVCFPAGLYARNNSQSLPFNRLHQMHPDITLVAAAGNDSSSKEFYPAAYPWAIGVGALAPDQQHIASFSNIAGWVNVFVLGEGLINAYAFGEYKYQEPPRIGTKKTFQGIAKWSGTSFSTPLFAGLIVREMEKSGSTAAVATQTVLNNATSVSGYPAVLFPPP
jgi:hypothetical protein